MDGRHTLPVSKKHNKTKSGGRKRGSVDIVLLITPNRLINKLARMPSKRTLRQRRQMVRG
jgi:hypothetical protein